MKSHIIEYLQISRAFIHALAVSRLPLRQPAFLSLL